MGKNIDILSRKKAVKKFLQQIERLVFQANKDTNEKLYVYMLFISNLQIGMDFRNVEKYKFNLKILIFNLPYFQSDPFCLSRTFWSHLYSIDCDPQFDRVLIQIFIESFLVWSFIRSLFVC